MSELSGFRTFCGQQFTEDLRRSTDLSADLARNRILFFRSPCSPQGSHTPAKNPPCASDSACLLHCRIPGQDEQTSFIIWYEYSSGMRSWVQGRSWWC